jgi:hypothetical protein
MSWRYIVMATGTLVSGSQAANSQMTAADGWAAMTKCAAIADDVARHRCSDDVLRGAGLLTPHFGLETSPARTPQATAQAAASEAKRPSDDQARVTLATVAPGADGKLVLTTTDGAVWRQVESNAVRPTPAQGQTMTIERTRFGGFMCKPGKWVAFRCYRAR